jgi:putative peptide zinc metalloprotease protein
MSYERLTKLLKIGHGAGRARRSVLTLALAAFVPLAIPASASATTFPPSWPVAGYDGNVQQGVFVNQVDAVAQTRQPVFKVKFQLAGGITPTSTTAVNRADARTRCSGCSATAIAFQVVTTTDQDLSLVHALDVATATNAVCAPHCNAVADAYQLVVATDTPNPLAFGTILTPDEMFSLYDIRSEFLSLPSSGLTMSQIQSECQDLANQVAALFEEGSAGGFGYAAFTRPSFSPGEYGFGPVVESAPSSQPIVKLYRDIQFDPWTAG